MTSVSVELDREWNRWVAWLGGPGDPSIWDDVVAMMAARQIWDGHNVVQHNAPPQALKAATFASWVAHNYVGRQAMAVRRQVDIDRRVISLGRLIHRVGRHPDALSRDRFAARATWASREESDRLFDDFVGAGRVHIDPDEPKADLSTLRTGTAKVVRYATNELAHYNKDKGKFSERLTFGDLHSAIDVVVDLSVKYRSLIMGATMSKTVAMYDWIHVFREPWIPDDDREARMSQRIQEITRKRERREPIIADDFII